MGDAPAYGVDGGGDGSSGNDGGGSGLLDFGPDVPTVDLQRDITCWGPCLGRCGVAGGGAAEGATTCLAG